MTKMQENELRFMRWLRKGESRLMTLFLYWCTELGSYKGWTLLSAILVFLMNDELGWSIGFSSLFGGFCAQLIKRSVQRERPCKNPQFPQALIAAPDPWSFPSGHTTSAFSVASMLWYIEHAWFWPFMIFAWFVGISRMYLGVHYPSDVVFGAMLGMICGCLFGCIW